MNTTFSGRNWADISLIWNLSARRRDAAAHTEAICARKRTHARQLADAAESTKVIEKIDISNVAQGAGDEAPPTRRRSSTVPYAEMH